MTDYSELVKALRSASTVSTAWEKLMRDAATAIEALQAAEPTERQVVDYCHKRCLVVLDADFFHELKASYGMLPKRGKWVDDEFGAKCSYCGKYAYWSKFEIPWKSPYCPICGAKMEVQE